MLVAGDCMLDEYIWGQATRISPEAPVMVVDQLETTHAAGGATNVAVNVVAMDGQASIVAVVGKDSAADQLRAELGKRGVRNDGLIEDGSRPTTVKTRIIAHSHQLLRVDRERRGPVAAEAAGNLVAAVERQLEWAEAVVLSDYAKGVLTEAVVSAILERARAAGRPVAANPKPANLPLFRGLSLLTLNQSEAETVTGRPLADRAAIEAAGREVLESTAAEAVILTLGGRGLVLFEREEAPRHLPVVPLEVYDPCGCGDSAIAAAVLARAAGGTWVEAATVANLAGNAKVRKLGVVPVTRQDIERVWRLGDSGGNGGLPEEETERERGAD